MKIAVEGCAHGDLETIYDTIEFIEKRDNIKVDLLLCCGDFQSTRNVHDLNSMAVPPKYREMCTFYKYFSGEKVAPVLTIFIGGNHEASSYLQELPYGGWVAPNIYYLGLSGVINVRGIRIAGLSGIYKSNDFMLGRYERPPYTEQSKRSVYHIRNLDVFRLKQLKRPIDIFLSHDWPKGVHKFGNISKILKFKAHLKEDIDSNKLGSPPSEELLHHLKPKYWFSAHLHCKFAALISHQDKEREKTKFLALDKCLPRRKFLQIMEFESEDSQEIRLEYDEEWLSVLHFTNHLISYRRDSNILPNKDFAQDNIRWDFSPTEVEIEFVKAKMSDDFVVPLNFVATASSYVPGQPPESPAPLSPNPQTQAFCRRLGISDIFEEILVREPLASDLLNRRVSGSPASSRFNSFVESDLGNGSSEDEGDDQEEEEADTEQLSTPSRSSAGYLDICSPIRTSLTLPPPKNSQEDGDTDSSSPSVKRSSTSPVFASPDPSEKSPFVIDTSPLSTPLTHKKFKRRNQDIYASNCDET